MVSFYFKSVFSYNFSKLSFKTDFKQKTKFSRTKDCIKFDRISNENIRPDSNIFHESLETTDSISTGKKQNGMLATSKINYFCTAQMIKREKEDRWKNNSVMTD